MNIYVEPIISQLTETQLYVVNESDKVFDELGSEYHIGELLITDFDKEDSVPAALMEIYEHYVDRELDSHVILQSDEVTLYDKVTILTVVAKILFGRIYTEVEIHSDLTEEEFMPDIMGQLTDYSSIYWEDKVNIGSDLYEMFNAGLIQEVDEDDVPEVDLGVKERIKAYISTIDNYEMLVTYGVIISSGTLPIPFDMTLKALAEGVSDDIDKTVLITEVELLEIATDAHNTTPDWKEHVSNVFGYFPSKVSQMVDGF